MTRHYLVSFFCLTVVASSFNVGPTTNQRPTALLAHSSRRDFVAASIGTAFLSIVSAGVEPAFALDDLAMPSAEEDAKSREVSK